METAGKQVDDEKLREAMKENGIGRPSTRANIIETLYKRKYIYNVRKNVLPTTMGVKLMEFISNDLLKSAELTGIWEQKLRQIETGKYQVSDFMDELKQMVSDLVFQVRNDYSKGKIVIEENDDKELKTKNKPTEKAKTEKELTCPRCKKGTMLKGKGAWGCSGYATGCKTLIPFTYLDKKLTNKQITSLILKGKTPVIKGFVVDGNKVDGQLSFSMDYTLQLQQQKSEQAAAKPQELNCPRCKQGYMMQGSTAWGCSNYKNGCKLRVPFEFLKNNISQTHMESLILKGKTQAIKGFSLSDNETDVTGFLDWDANFNLRFNKLG